MFYMLRLVLSDIGFPKGRDRILLAEQLTAQAKRSTGAKKEYLAARLIHLINRENRDGCDKQNWRGPQVEGYLRVLNSIIEDEELDRMGSENRYYSMRVYFHVNFYNLLYRYVRFGHEGRDDRPKRYDYLPASDPKTTQESLRNMQEFDLEGLISYLK